MNTALMLPAYSICLLAIFCCGQASLSKQQKLTLSQADSCDNPDASVNCCFLNMPAALSTVMTLASEQEPGEGLVISGTIFKEDGRTPYPGLILYAYQTDNTGHYTKKGTETGVQKWHGRLHGWCKTDSKGVYQIHSIRPARYPDNSMPAHIHAAIKTEKGQAFYISDFVFKDDSLVNKKYLSSIFTTTGGTGVVDIKKTGKIWMGKRDIMLKE